MVDELERIRNRWLQHSVKYYFSIFPGGLEKTTEFLGRIQPVVFMP